MSRIGQIQTADSCNTAEIFEERRKKIEKVAAQFDKVANQALERNRIAFKQMLLKLGAGFASGNFGAINDTLDEVCRRFGIEIPYCTPDGIMGIYRKGVFIS